MQTTVSGSQMLIGLAVGIILLIFLIMRTKIHAFPALIFSAAVVGLVGGVPIGEINNMITKGFGNTLGSIGIIIGFGVMMGQIFEVSGGAEKMAQVFLRTVGKGREELALTLTGFVVSIPIFCDSGFVILSPLAKALSRRTKKSVIALGVSLAVGLVITHSLVPPTPGPLGVAGIFNVNVGSIILWGLVLAVPMAIAGMLYAKWIGRRIYQLPGEKEGEWIRPGYQEPVSGLEENGLNRNLPSAWAAFAPIVVPIILILLNTVLTAMKQTGPVIEFIKFIGTPIIAVGIGLLFAIYGLTWRSPRKPTIDEMEKGIKSAGIIILVTGGGGALGQVLRDSGTGDYIAKMIAQTALPAILLPFIVASLVRLIQGSGTVAMITSASITAPIIATLGVNPVFAALAACVGSLCFSYFNDSYFWVVNRLLGISEAREQIRVWSFASTVVWAVGLVEILILNAILG